MKLKATRDRRRGRLAETAMVVIVMGVSGAGKTTVGRILARRLGWNFYDADDFHPASNRKKMGRGIPLDDEDRWPWLRVLRRLIDQCLAGDTSAIIACSALKQSYRDMLMGGAPAVRLVFLKGSQALIADRMGRRARHFFDKGLLKSQFEVLEEPKNAVVVDISGAPEATADAIQASLGLLQRDDQD